MKKILLILALTLSVSAVNAWNNIPDEAIMLVASKNLTKEGKELVTKYLGDSYADDVCYIAGLEKAKKSPFSKEVHYLHFDKNLKPAKVDGDDALAAIEKALEVVRARKSHTDAEVTKALRIVIDLMCDIHIISNVRIEGVAHSQSDFSFQWYNGDAGKRKTLSTIKWSKMWVGYPQWHNGFSPQLWCEDLEYSLGSKREEFAKGSLNDWIAQIGDNASKFYARINPEYVMTRRERNELEGVNCEMMARAAYRLAALFNELAK